MFVRQHQRIQIYLALNEQRLLNRKPTSTFLYPPNLVSSIFIFQSFIEPCFRISHKDSDFSDFEPCYPTNQNQFLNYLYFREVGRVFPSHQITLMFVRRHPRFQIYLALNESRLLNRKPTNTFLYSPNFVSSIFISTTHANQQSYHHQIAARIINHFATFCSTCLDTTARHWLSFNFFS